MNNFKIGIGFRNPYRFEVINNLIYVFDVGQTAYEEINILNTAKSNVQDFGWPYYEGRKPINLMRELQEWKDLLLTII